MNVSSAMAHRSIPLQAASRRAKHATKELTVSVVTELRHDHSKVRVCLLTLPGANTPQFHWNETKMPGHPQPVPPVHQPELAGEAVAFLAEHPRRNLWMGVPATYTVLGERVAPGFLDWYLAHARDPAPGASEHRRSLIGDAFAGLGATVALAARRWVTR